MKKINEYLDLDSYDDDTLSILKDEYEELKNHYEEAKQKNKQKDALYWRNKLMGVSKKIKKLQNNDMYVSESFMDYFK